MEKQNLFKWKHYQADIILLTVRWYLRYNLSFCDLVEMMEERVLYIAHTTIMRWYINNRTATYILSGIEAMHTVKKDQPHHREKSVQNEVEFIHKLFGVAA